MNTQEYKENWNNIITDLLYQLSTVINDYRVIINLFRINRHWYQYYHDVAFWKQWTGVIQWQCPYITTSPPILRDPSYLYGCKRWRFNCHARNRHAVAEVGLHDCSFCAQVSQHIVSDLTTLEITPGFLNRTQIQLFLRPHCDTLQELTINLCSYATAEIWADQIEMSSLSLPNLQKFSLLDSSPDEWLEEWIHAFLVSMPNLQTLNIQIPRSIYGEFMLVKAICQLKKLTRLRIRLELESIEHQFLHQLSLLSIQSLHVDIGTATGRLLPVVWHKTLEECTLYDEFCDNHDPESDFVTFCEEFETMQPGHIQFDSIWCTS